MYAETDFTEVKSQLRKIIILVTAIFLVFLIPSVVYLLRKPQWIGATVLSLGLCLDIFIWGVYGTPILSYYRYIKDIREGRTREMRGSVVRVTDEPVYKDNRLLYYEVSIQDDVDGVDRVLLFDSNKGTPPLEDGKNYFFRTYQSFIIQVDE